MPSPVKSPVSEHRLSPEEHEVLEWLVVTEAIPLSLSQFLTRVDLEPLLEDGEFFEEFIASDPDTQFYEFSIDSNQFLGLKNCGMHTLFSDNGDRPPFEKLPAYQSFDEYSCNTLAWVLAPANSVKAHGVMGDESQRFHTNRLLCLDGSRGLTRLQWLIDDQPVAAIAVENDVVHTLYTHSQYRRGGLASKLFEVAQSLFPNLQHSESLTDSGKQFVGKKPDRFDALSP